MKYGLLFFSFRNCLRRESPVRICIFPDLRPASSFFCGSSSLSVQEEQTAINRESAVVVQGGEESFFVSQAEEMGMERFCQVYRGTEVFLQEQGDAVPESFRTITVHTVDAYPFEKSPVPGVSGREVCVKIKQVGGEFVFSVFPFQIVMAPFAEGPPFFPGYTSQGTFPCCCLQNSPQQKASAPFLLDSAVSVQPLPCFFHFFFGKKGQDVLALIVDEMGGVPESVPVVFGCSC